MQVDVEGNYDLYYIHIDSRYNNKQPLFLSRFEMACSNTAMVKNSPENLYDMSTCILHSFLEGKNRFGKNSVTEYSWMGKGSSVGEQSIISNVFVCDELSLPSDVLLHTVCVRGKNQSALKYVTVSFDIKDDVKKTCSDFNSADELKWHSQPLDDAVKRLGYSKVLFDSFTLQSLHIATFNSSKKTHVAC